MTSKIIGIDLGTTNSCIAVFDGTESIVIPNRIGSRTTPSIVAINETGERLVGQVAKRQSLNHPKSTITAIKRLMGKSYDEAIKNGIDKSVNYDIVKVPNSAAAGIKIRDQIYTPQEISAIILSELKEVANDYLGEEITKAVITVPAYFNNTQRQATKDAGRIAGLDVLRVINEPTAASLAYGLELSSDKTIAVYDFGGGTFDISILTLGDGVYEVLSTAGDTMLGGEDFNHAIVEMLINEFQHENHIDLRQDKAAIQRLHEAAESAKHELSVTPETEINMPFIALGPEGPLHLSRSFKRSELEELCIELVERSIEPCRQALSDAGVTTDQIDEIVLVGGMTRMPLIQQKVSEFFNLPCNHSVNPDEAVAIGASLQGGVLKGDIVEVVLMDVTPLTLGIETQGGIFQPLIPRNTSVPCEMSDIFTTAADFQDMVRVHVLQGEREMAADNHSLAYFELFGIPPAPRGMPQIEVSFSIDSNGIVSVSALEKATGKKQSVRVEPTGSLSDRQVEEMIASANAQREQDKKVKEKVEALNTARGLHYSLMRSYRELTENLTEPTKTRIEKIDRRIEEMIDNPTKYSLDEITKLHKELENAAELVATEAFSAMS